MNKKYLPIALVLILAVFAALGVYLLGKGKTGLGTPAGPDPLTQRMTNFKSVTDECGRKIPKTADATMAQKIVADCLREQGYSNEPKVEN